MDADDGPSLVIADPVRLAQVLNNLLSNAIKFTDRGEIRLHARHDAEASASASMWWTREIDLPENLARLFERFRQIDGSTTRRAEGTGWASPSRAIWPRCTVDIDGDKRGGRGSTFTVSSPIDQPPAEVVSCRFCRP